MPDDPLAQFDEQFLTFYVNGRRVQERRADPRTSLAVYLRDYLQLKGTKIGCNEGGCGACTVMISDVDPTNDDKIRHYSIIACLMPLGAVFGKAVTTVESVGGPLSAAKRLHPVQDRLAKTHGSQCGYCTPGFVMAMYSLLRNHPRPTEAQVDECLQENLCRCTGYRPILEAFYSFVPKPDGTARIDREAGCIENGGTVCATSCRQSCQKFNTAQRNGHCKTDGGTPTIVPQNGQIKRVEDRMEKLKLIALDDNPPYDPSREPSFPAELLQHKWHRRSLDYSAAGGRWLQPTSLDHLLELKRLHPRARLIAGNTELGIESKFRFTTLPILINPKQVPELCRVRIDDTMGVFVGMGLSLSDVHEELTGLIDTQPEWKTTILRSVCDILYHFAGKHVRNVATIAGNIVTASPISDLNPIWMAAGARVVLASAERGERLAPVDETMFVGYRKTAIAADEVLTGIWMPFSRPTQHFCAYKQAQRRDDDIAIVTGAFSVTLSETTAKNALPTVRQLRIAYGGMAAVTKPASRRLCDAAVGRPWDASLLEDLSAGLLEEFRLAPDVPGGMPHYRMTLALSFLHKFHSTVAAHYDLELTVDGENGPGKAGFVRRRPFHTTQIYPDVPADQPAIDPVGRPLVHASGEKHTTGEAIYAGDTKIFDCLHLAYVTSPVACGKIDFVDPTEALRLDGVVDYVNVDDVPGSNDVCLGDTPIFARDQVFFHGQPIGAIVAVDHETARRAANLVKVEITAEKPIVTIEEAIREERFFPMQNRIHSARAGQSDHSQPVGEYQMNSDEEWRQKYENFVEGQIRMGGQEHFYLETQNCVVIPDEGGEIDVISSTQSINDVQRDVAAALAVPRHRVRVTVRRIGGGFGGKEFAAGWFAAAAAVAAVKLRRPVRVVLERYDDMAVKGTRHPFRFDYKLAIDLATRRLLDFRVTAYSNSGYALDLSAAVMERCLTHLDNVYHIGQADFVGHLCRTDTSSNTVFRGSGSPQGMFAVETALKHAAEQFGIDVDELRAANFYQEGDRTPFGMHLRQCNVSRCWAECLALSDYATRRDGPVAAFNAQHRHRKRGIYATPTKFGVGFGVKHLNRAGALVHVYTDGSVLVSHGGMEMGQGLHTKILQDACQNIVKRLKPYRNEKPNNKWDDWVSAAYFDRVSLSVTGSGIIHFEPVDFQNGRGGELFGYCVYGVAVTEAEIDCLTGDHHILRTDIVMDIGDSLNPAVDIGQIEGAFVQGYGLFTMEQLKISPSGERLTRGPGTYKIPTADDVPREFHVKLLKGSSNRNGIYSSKAVGEPPLFLGASALFAIREAIRAYRVGECGRHDYFRLDSPATPERIRMSCADAITDRVCDPISTKTIEDESPWNVEL